MAGGHATSSGLDFQYEAAAWAAVHILTQRPITEISAAIPISIRLEAITPVDDIVIETATGHLYINVKSGVGVSIDESSPLGTVVDQFVRQWLSGCSKNDRLVLVVKPQSRNFSDPIISVLSRLRDQSDLHGLTNTKGEKAAFNSLIELIKKRWKIHTNAELSNDTLLKFLSIIRVVPLHTSETAKHALETILLPVTEKATDTRRLLEALKTIAADYAKRRSGADIAGLRDALRKEQIPLKASLEYQRDIDMLVAFTANTLQGLSHYGFIPVQGTNTSGQLEISRVCTEIIVRSAKERSFLITGEPGSGKSGTLQAAARRLRDEGHPVVVLAVDQLEAASLEGLRLDLGIDQPIIDVLAEWKSDKTPVLFIDALDASRGGSSDGAVHQLLRELQRRAPHWTTVASIRKFDLRYGTIFQHIFKGAPIDEQFKDVEFNQVEHINVPTLDQDEINSVCAEWPRLNKVLKVSSPEFRKLLSSPFNLYLLALIFANSEEVSNPAKTQLDLLEQFWRWRVLGNSSESGFKNEIALKLLVSKMRESRRLAIPKDLLRDNVEDIVRMLHNGILVNPKTGAKISFAHHVLFDFALAKLELLAEGTESLYQQLTSAEDDMLLIAPSAMLALQSIWNDENGRQQFWEFTFKFASNIHSGSFVRSLPAKAIVELATLTSDLSPLISHLSSNHSDAAVFLVKHIYGVLLAQVVAGTPNLNDDEDPWCEITELICETAIDKVIWPVNVALREWTDKKENLTNKQIKHLGKAARAILKHQLENPAKYNETSITASIIATIRTMATDPLGSEQILRVLIDPDRVFKHGHIELFWVAQEFKTIAEFAPLFAGEMLLAAYTSALPSSDETTSMSGSRIMSLTSNKKQDFEGVLYSLEKNLTWFSQKYPEVAAKAIREILIVLVPREHVKTSDTHTLAQIGSRAVCLHADNSFIWWSSGSTHHYDKAATILDNVVQALKEALKSDLHAFSKLTDGLLFGEIPSSIASAVITALNDYLGEFPNLATEIILSPPLLLSIDTSYPAGELLRKLHPIIPPETRHKVETLILNVVDEDDKERLASCISVDHIIDVRMKEYYLARTVDRPLRSNTPHFEMHTRWGGEDNWWLKSQGVDLEAEQTKSFISLIKDIEVKELPSDDKEALKVLLQPWSLALKLLQLLNSNPTIHRQLENQSLDAVAELCTKICERCSSSEELALFSDIRQTIDLCLLPHLNVPSEHNAEREQQFETAASWGRPAPRVEATQALLAYIRANQSASKEDVELVLKLATDPAVEVRHTLLSRANLVCLASPELSKELARIAFEEEKNTGVLTFFLGSYANYMVSDIDWATEKILSLDLKIPTHLPNSRHNLCENVVNLILSLWLKWDKEDARERLLTWAANSLEHRSRIQPLLGDMRSLILVEDGEISDSKLEKIRSHGLQLFSCIVESLVSTHRKLLFQAKMEQDVSEELRECTRLLDKAAHEIYFGSKAYEISNRNMDIEIGPSPALRHRFLTDYLPVMNLLASVPYPSITHPILETIEVFAPDWPEAMLRLLIETIKGGGQSGGYTFEGLGAELVVKLVRRFLADYPSLISSTHEFRVGIVEILDQFAEAGWPDARKLVYELPEMLR